MFLIVLTLVLTGCGAPSAPGDAARIDTALVSDLKPGDARAVSAAVNGFAFDLFREVRNGPRNTVTAPLSMTALLALLLAGADGATAREIAGVLHLENHRDVRVGALLRQLADTDEVTVSVANALWADPDSPLEEDYLSFVRRALGATAEQADLGAAETAGKIDEWVRENTNGLIDGVAGDLGLPDPAASLALLNAVYFLGEWRTRFDPAATRQAPFTLPGGASAAVPTMHLHGETFGYTQRDGYRMVRLPYGEDGRYGMEILLPDRADGLDRLLASLDAASWQAAVDSLTDQTIDELALPRFELRWQSELTGALRKLGMTTAFTAGDADFGTMSPARPTLSTVAHKTYIRVDEKGTEAAAVSGGAMVTSLPSNRTVFRVNRPFAFTISDRETSTILFLGAVTDPRA